MKTTQVALPDSLMFKLAQICAGNVHSAVISMHVRLTGSESAIAKGWRTEEIKAVRAIVRSLDAGGGHWSDRREFVTTLKFCFKDLRKEKRTDARWQNYIRRVQEFHPEHVTAEAHAKLLLAA